MSLEKTIRINVDQSGAINKINALDKSVNRLDSTAKQSSNSFGALRASVVAVAAALQVRVIAQYSDAWKSVNNSLRTSITSTQSLEKAQSDVLRIAQESRSPLQAVAKLYGGISAASNELGVSQQDVAKFTELASKAISVQGSSAGESAGALLQLRQAIGGTVIQAQEFNSLIDGARPLLEAVAAGSDRFGGSVNKLREEVRKGTVTSKEFFDAALVGSKIIDERFNKSVATLSQSLTIASNNAIEFVGKNEQINTVMGTTADAVIFLSENLDKVIIAGLSFAGVFGGKMLISLALSTAEKAKNTVASITLARAERAAAISALSVAKSEQSATVAMFNASTGSTKASIASNQLAAANARLAASALAAAEAEVALGAATKIGGLALLGGPLGIAFLAAGAISAFAISATDARTPTEKLAEQVDNLAQSFNNLSSEQIAPKLSNATLEVNKLSQELLKAESKLKDISSGAFSFADITGEVATLKLEIKRLREEEEKAIITRDALFKVGIDAGRTPQSGETQSPKNAEDKSFTNNEAFKTSSLKNQLTERRAIQQAFNELLLQDFQSTADEERAIAEFSRRSGLLVLETSISDSVSSFEKRRKAILDNVKLSDDEQKTLVAELREQELIQTELFEIQRAKIIQDAASKNKEIDEQEGLNVFINGEIQKTDALSIQLTERRAVQQAFNELLLQDFQTLADEERAIAEFSRQSEAAGLKTEIQTSSINFERRREEILLNAQLDADAKSELVAELRAQELIQTELFEIRNNEISQNAADERARIADEEARLKMQIVTGNANAILGAISALGKNSVKIQKGVALASAGIAIATGIARANELGFPAAIGEIARVVAVGASVFSTIKGTNVGSSQSVSASGGGSGGGVSSARQEPVTQSNVIEFRGLSEVAEELKNLDPGEVLPVEFTQRIVSSLDEFNRLS